MAFIKWSDEYSVGVIEIDDQHKKLFEMIDDFYDAMRADNKKALEDLLNSLAEYTMYHFRTEENYFDKFRYADSEKHKKEHQVFVDKVLDVKSSMQSGKFVISVDVTNFIKKWILDHVAVTDKKYTQCSNHNGLH